MADPHHEDRVFYTIAAIAIWAVGGLLLAGLLLNQGQSTLATAVFAVGLALAVYSWFGKGRVADAVRFPGHFIGALLQGGPG